MRISDWSSDVCSSDLLVLSFVSRRLFGSDDVSMMAKSGLLRSATPVRSWKYIPLSASSCAKAGVARAADARTAQVVIFRSEEHTSELQSLMRISYAVFCLKKKSKKDKNNKQN